MANEIKPLKGSGMIVGEAKTESAPESDALRDNSVSAPEKHDAAKPEAPANDGKKA